MTTQKQKVESGHFMVVLPDDFGSDENEAFGEVLCVHPDELDGQGTVFVDIGESGGTCEEHNKKGGRTSYAYNLAECLKHGWLGFFKNMDEATLFVEDKKSLWRQRVEQEKKKRKDLIKMLSYNGSDTVMGFNCSFEMIPFGKKGVIVDFTGVNKLTFNKKLSDGTVYSIAGAFDNVIVLKMLPLEESAMKELRGILEQIKIETKMIDNKAFEFASTSQKNYLAKDKTTLKKLQYDVNTLKDRIKNYGSRVDDAILAILETEYENIRVEDNGKLLVATTKPITIKTPSNSTKEHLLGRFIISIIAGAGELRIRHESGGAGIHPHISDSGGLCGGNTDVHQLSRDSNSFDVLALIPSMLKRFSATGGPYRNMERCLKNLNDANKQVELIRLS